MLSFLLLYFVYKYFRDLARKYKVKQEWKYSLAGVLAYFGFQFLFLIVWGIAEIIINPNYALESNTSLNSGIGFIALLFSMLMLYFLHKYLEKRLKQKNISSINEIDEIGLKINNE